MKWLTADVKKRFLEGMKRARYNQVTLSGQLGYKGRAVSEWLGKRTCPSVDMLLLACEAMDIRPEWLLFGIGPMAATGKIPPSRARESSKPGAQPDPELGAGPYLPDAAEGKSGVPELDAQKQAASRVAVAARSRAAGPVKPKPKKGRASPP